MTSGRTATRLIVAFDVDGTLIDLTGSGTRAMNRAFSEILGIDGPPPSSFAGSTDLAIVGDRFSEALGGRAPTRDELHHFFERYLDVLSEEVMRTPHSPTPGAPELIDMLVRNHEFIVGLATGNLHDAAWIKLESAGLGRRLDFGAFGDEVSSRAELVRLAIGRARACCGASSSITAVVVGDTPRDIDAAREAGGISIAVATGPFDVGTLRDHGADHAFESLAETSDISFWRSLFDASRVRGTSQ